MNSREMRMSPSEDELSFYLSEDEKSDLVFFDHVDQVSIIQSKLNTF